MTKTERRAGRECDSPRLHHKHYRFDRVASVYDGGDKYRLTCNRKFETDSLTERSKTLNANDNQAYEAYALAA